MGFFGKDKEEKEAEKKAANREALKAQALANMRGARDRLGDDTIQEIAAALRNENKSAGKRAEEKIRSLDKDKVVDHLKWMIDEDK